MFCAQASLNLRCGPEGTRRVITIAVDPLPAGCEMKWNDEMIKWSKFWVFDFYQGRDVYGGFWNMKKWLL